jgi:hypothetical protein
MKLNTVFGTCVQSAKYEFASSNTTRMTFAFDARFIWKLAHLEDERSGFFYRKSTATIDAIEHVLNVANSYLAYRISFWYILTVHKTHFGLCIALISRALALTSNCKCIT